MIIILTDADEEAVLDRLLSSTSIRVVPAEPPESGDPVAEEETSVAPEPYVPPLQPDDDPDDYDPEMFPPAPTPRKGNWTPEEDAVVAAAASSKAAVEAYEKAFPQYLRSGPAVSSHWYALREKVAEKPASEGSDAPAPMKYRPGQTVQILLSPSPYFLARARIARRNVRAREYLVCPEDSTARIWIAEDLLREVPE